MVLCSVVLCNAVLSSALQLCLCLRTLSVLCSAAVLCDVVFGFTEYKHRHTTCTVDRPGRKTSTTWYICPGDICLATLQALLYYQEVLLTSMQELLPSKIECSPNGLPKTAIALQLTTRRCTTDGAVCTNSWTWLQNSLPAVCEPLGDPAAPSWNLCPSSGWPHSAHCSLHLPRDLMAHLLHNMLMCENERNLLGPLLCQTTQN